MKTYTNPDLPSEGKSPVANKTISFRSQRLDDSTLNIDENLNDSIVPMRSRINRGSPTSRTSVLRPTKNPNPIVLDPNLDRSVTPTTQGGSVSRGSIAKEKKNPPRVNSIFGKNLAESNPLNAFLSKVTTMARKNNLDSDSSDAEYKVIKPEKMVEKIYLVQGYHIIYPRFIISHTSRFRSIWNMIYVTYLTILVVILPYEIAYLGLNEFTSAGPLLVNILMIIIFWLDNIIYLRTTYIDKQENEIVDGKMIFRKKALSIEFFCMVFMSIPVFLFIQAAATNTVTLKDKNWLLLQMCRALFPRRTFRTWLKNVKLSLLWRMMTTFGLVFLAIHMMTCLWFGLAAQDYFNKKLIESKFWIPTNFQSNSANIYKDFYEDSAVILQYTHTLYMISLLIAGGDIVPVDRYQIPLATIINLIGSLLVGFIFGNITYLISKWNAEKNEYFDKREQLQQRMAQNNIPATLQSRISDYFEVQWKKKQIFHRYSNFESYSEPLKRDLIAHMYSDVIVNVPFFSNLEPPEILAIIKRLKTQLFMPGDYIVHEGEKGTEMFFIIEGTVKVTSASMKKQNGDASHGIMLKKGDHFGEFALVSNSRRSSDVVSMDYCILEVLERNDYLSLSSEFDGIIPRLKEGIKTFKRQRIDQIVDSLSKIAIFANLSRDDLKLIALEYLDEEFIDPNTLVLGPKPKPKSLYVIILGVVNKFPSDKSSAEYIRIHMFQEDHLLTTLSKEKLIKLKDMQALPALDDLLEQQDWSAQDFDQVLSRAERLERGSSFGSVEMDDMSLSNEFYYFTETACNILIMSQSATQRMKYENNEIYVKIRRNLRDMRGKGTSLDRIRTEEDTRSQRVDTQQSKNFEKGLENFGLNELERKVSELSSLINQMKLKKD